MKKKSLNKAPVKTNNPRQRNYRKPPLQVKVGVCSIQCYNVNQCERLAKVAQKLSDSVPVTVKSESFEIKSGTMEQVQQATGITKALADQSPVEASIMGNRVKAPTMKKFWIATLTLLGVTVGIVLLKRKLRNNTTDQGGDDTSNKTELTVRQADEIEKMNGHYDDHQLLGKFLYENDVCLCYGAEHIAKTSIILCWIVDIVLQRTSFMVLDDDKGKHPPYTCLWFNGEMDEADFQNFYGDFDRSRLRDKLFILGDFSDLNLDGWLEKVKEQLLKCTTDTIVVLDNLSCICNSTGVEVSDMKNSFQKLQNEAMKKNGIHTTFIIIDHINKKNDVSGTYKLKALVSNRIRFEKYAPEHTKITIEKNRKYHDMVDKSFDLLWTVSPEGNKSFVNLGEIVENDSQEPPGQDSTDELSKYDGDKYTAKQMIEFHEIVRETGNKSEAQRRTGVTRQAYDKDIGKFIKAGLCTPIADTKSKGNVEK